MGILNSFLYWWDGAPLGTYLNLMGKKRVGEDELGNVYYEGGKDLSGRPRRWVIYKGSNDASRVPADWFSWLHHQIEGTPDESLPPVRVWEKPSHVNLTGTAQAYRPAGAIGAGEHRARATGDYEAWSPDA